MKSYCTQNNGDCSTCSLVNYGRDCQNKSVNWGGKRPGAGHKAPTGRTRHIYYATEAENAKIREFIEQIRNPSK